MAITSALLIAFTKKRQHAYFYTAYSFFSDYRQPVETKDAKCVGIM